MKPERYLRQTLFQPIGREGQERLSKALAVVVGCGAIGSATAGLLARSGVGYLKVIDRDILEESNLQRQELFDEEDLKEGLPKALAAEKKLRLINSGINIEGITADLNPCNAESLLIGAQAILDGTDNFETRLLLNDYALKNKTPLIYAACLGSQALLMNIFPGKTPGPRDTETPCLRCLVDSLPAPGILPTCETAGILAPAAKLVASLQTTEALKILTSNPEALISGLVNIDIWKGTFQKLDTRAARSSTCPACQKGEYEFLNAKSFSVTSTLCGANAIQITPGPSIKSNGSKIDLYALSERLKSIPDVSNLSQSPYLLKFNAGARCNVPLHCVVFPDGRALIFGTNDSALARTLYSQYIGL